MQDLIKDIKPSLPYRKAVLKMHYLDIDQFAISEGSHQGHSPYAFEKITLWLRYQHGMSINDIIDYLAKFDSKSGLIKIHKNSWVRWSTPQQKGQSSNMLYETWVPVKEAINSLLSSHKRQISDFTNEPTYTPEFTRKIRETLQLDHDEFAEILGLASAENASLLENTDPRENKRGMGYEDWAGLLDKLRLAQQLKAKMEANPVQILSID